MSMDAATPAAAGDSPALRSARAILRQQADCLRDLASRLDTRFDRAMALLLDCRGSVMVTGMGKAGLVGRKIAATLASTGARSHFLHPAEALHGDLGRVHADDVVLALSNSGETEELVRLLPALADLGVDLVAITAHGASTLARAATVTLELGAIAEACHLGLAPSTSTTAMLALGDALALTLSRARGLRRDDFNRHHPGGSLGKRLGRVEALMRPLSDCRLARQSHTVREVFARLGRPGRRSGAIMLTSDDGRLQGVFTDSDLARLFEQRRDAALDRPIAEVMTRQPTAVVAGSRAQQAISLLARRKLSELPVVDTQGVPLGMLDITDLVGLMPALSSPESTELAPSDESSGGGPRLAVFHEPPDPAGA
jgi:arabinose-5-phosphate isomerase